MPGAGSRRLQELSQVTHDNVRPVRFQLRGLTYTINSYDIAKAARTTCLHTGQRVLEHRCLRRLHSERPCAGKERVGSRLASQVLALCDGQRTDMTAAADGWWSGPDLAWGSDYAFLLDDSTTPLPSLSP